MEQTKTLPPLVSDEQIRNDVTLTVRATPNRTMEVKDLPLTPFQVRDIYEADRQRTREVVQALCNGIETMRQGSFADRFIFADDADLGAHADSLLALAKSRLQIEPTK